MHVFITGSQGLIGKALITKLKEAGHEVTKLVRHPTEEEDERNWETNGRNLSPEILNGCDSLIHLAGEPISGWRWTNAKKKAIYESRVDSTEILALAISKMSTPPESFIVASGCSYYGERGADVLDESERVGNQFLSEVAHDWEMASRGAEKVCRVVNLRTCMVLSKSGGALKTMLPAFYAGLGGTIGSGQQYWSWITLTDIVRVYEECLTQNELSGPINVGSPNPVTCREFINTLGKAIHRPTLIPLPSLAVKIGMGLMGKELLLTSTRVRPAKLEKSHFHFLHPTLSEAFQSIFHTSVK